MRKAMFSQRHFDALANLIKEVKSEQKTFGVLDIGTILVIESRLIDLLEMDNPKFNPQKWYNVTAK